MRDETRHDGRMPAWAGICFWAIITLLITLSVSKCFSAEPPTDWPESVSVGQLLILDAPESAENVAWSVYPADTIFRLVDANHAIVIETAASGTVIVALADASTEQVSVIQAAIVIGDGGPNPQPGPIVEGKLHVLLLYETDQSEPGSLTQEQTGILSASPILEYLDSHCVDEDGQPAYRFLDDDADTSNLAEDWRMMFNRAVERGDGKPWLLIASDGNGGYEGEPPADVDGMLELLERFGGE